MTKKDFIGVFDSGVGGISVLKQLVRQLPGEDFVYYGDSAHAPYGEKTPEEVRTLSQSIVDQFLSQGAKAIVIACNTATSAAAQMLRERYPSLPILGLEPAIKPAAARHDRVLIMATEMTLGLEKFHQLQDSLEGSAQFLPVACPGLARCIEGGDLEGKELQRLLHSLLSPYRGKADCVVLGCTHYPFIRQQIREVLGDIPMYDGAEGTSRHLEEELKRRGLLRCSKENGQVTFVSSLDTPKELALYRWMFDRDFPDGKEKE